MRTISKELAHRLEQLGAYQTSDVSYGDASSAFTLDEILDMLPRELPSWKCDRLQSRALDAPHFLISYYRSITGEHTFGYECYFRTNDQTCLCRVPATPAESCCDHQLEFSDRAFCRKNPAEAAGELLAWCIENRHVNFKKGEK